MMMIPRRNGNGLDFWDEVLPDSFFTEKESKLMKTDLKEKDGKYLLIQEAKKMCYGKWNFPAGRLEFKESLKQGAIREIKEETGCDVELNGVCYIANRILEDDLRIMVFFNAKLVNENIKYDKNEILDVKWIGYDEIMNKMDDELRGSYVKTAVYNKKNNLIAPIEIVDVLND